MKEQKIKLSLTFDEIGIFVKELRLQKRSLVMEPPKDWRVRRDILVKVLSQIEDGVKANVSRVMKK